MRLNSVDKKNALWNASSFIVTSILGFVNFSINYHTFTAQDFGLFILINAFFGIGNTIDFGFGISVVKHIAEAKESNDFRTIRSIYITFLLVFVSLALIITLIYALYFNFGIKNFNFYKEGDPIVVKNIFFLLLGAFFFRYIGNYLVRVYEGYAAFILVSRINMGISFLNTIFMFIIWIFKFPITVLAFGYFINGMLFFFALFFISIFKLQNLSFRLHYVDLRLARKYAMHSLNLQLSFLIYSFIDPFVKFILNKFFSLNMVTYYESAKKIVDLSAGVIVSAQKGLLNKLSEVNRVNRLSEFINTNLCTFSKMANYYSILLYGLLNVPLSIFIYFWFGNINPLIIFLLFLPTYSLINFGSSLYAVLMIEGKGFKLVLAQLTNFLAVVVFLLVTIFAFENYLGIIGLYIATILILLLLFKLLEKYYLFDYKEFIKLSNFSDIIILNLMTLSEFIAVVLFSEYWIFILCGYFLIYLIIFRRYIKYFYFMVTQKARNIIRYI